MNIRHPTVSLQTDPEQNKVVRDGRSVPVSRLAIHLKDNGVVELDIRTTNGYVPVTLTVTRAALTELASRWLLVDAPKRLLAKWRKKIAKEKPC